jgi:hypothetical protein
MLEATSLVREEKSGGSFVAIFRSTSNGCKQGGNSHFVIDEPERAPCSGLDFRVQDGNNATCLGPGHSNLATATVAMEKTVALSPPIRALIFCVSERRKLEPHGFISNWPNIRISGCLR